MDFRLTDEQELYRRMVAEFVDAEVVPVAGEIDELGEFPRQLFVRMAELGYFGTCYPEEYGGSNADFVTYCLWAEELARGSMALAAIACMQSLMGTHFVFKYGSEVQRQKYVVPALRGEKVATFALTEPDAGSDLANLTTFAEKKAGGYMLRGTKTWVTNAPVADFLTVAAKTSRERGMKHLALFLVDRHETKGVRLSKKIEKLGVRAAETGEIALDDVELPESALLGGETAGLEQIGGILSEIRIMTAALSLGLARAAYDAGLRYSRERVTFGKPIGEHQAIAFKLADMLTAIHAAGLVTYHAAWRLDQQLPVRREAAMAKLVASEMANRVADDASRILASYGFAMEYPVQRFFRDARFLLFGGGTSEILRLVIARDLDSHSGIGSPIPVK